MPRYSINPESGIPVYRQLVDQINAQIRSGALAAGAQMPTVRELAQQMNLSCGTVKRAYDILREMGDIEMTRRRGSFVKYVREDRDSRKIRAMAAIDTMIRQLTEMNFSPSEIQIFINLKLRDWGLKWSGIRVALITRTAECAFAYERQLSQIANVHVSIYDFRQVREYPYNVDEESDIILASARDAQQLAPVLPDPEKLVRAAFAPEPECLRALLQCGKKRLGVMCEGDAYLELVRAHLPEGASAERCAAGEEARFDAMVCADAAVRDGIRFVDRLDEGSMIHLEERVNRIRETRMLQPGGFEVPRR